MIFKLNDEQINEIIEMYGGDKGAINTVQRKLNLLGVIESEEDYFEIVCAVIAQKETIKLGLDRSTTKLEKQNVFMSYDQIIELEINRKYSNFEDAKTSTIQRMKKL